VLAVVAAGGMLGAAARYGVGQLIHTAPDSFPWATFWTNVAGAFALGLGLILLLENHPHRLRLRAFFATGVVGAFTTMSTFEVETVTLFKDGHAAIGFAYGLGSVVAGLLAASAGIRIARAVGTRAAHAAVTDAAR
jgi:CrcB protein